METNLIDNLPKISPFISIGSSLILAILYVSSLYIWGSEQNRDHPQTIRKRFCSVSVVMLISPIFVFSFSSKEFLQNEKLLEVVGIRKNGLLPAIVVPLFLTSFLYLGPISSQILNGTWKTHFDIRYWIRNFQDILFLRNHIVAPLSEEFVFRSCMMPLLLQSFEPIKAMLISPLFFGVAHFHHMAERLRTGMELKNVLIISCFQFTYTTIFGFYSAYLFVRTNHLISPFLAHAFCNYMGLPNIEELVEETGLRKIILIVLYIVGFIGWILLLPILTKPQWFENNLYVKS